MFPCVSIIFDGSEGSLFGFAEKDPHLPRNLRSVGLGLTKSCALVGLSLIQEVFQTASRGIHSKPKHQSQQPQKNTSQQNITNIRNIQLNWTWNIQEKHKQPNNWTRNLHSTPWNPPFSHIFGEHFYFGHTMSHSTSSAEAVFANVVWHDIQRLPYYFGSLMREAWDFPKT